MSNPTNPTNPTPPPLPQSVIDGGEHLVHAAGRTVDARAARRRPVEAAAHAARLAGAPEGDAVTTQIAVTVSPTAAMSELPGSGLWRAGRWFPEGTTLLEVVADEWYEPEYFNWVANQKERA